MLLSILQNLSVGDMLGIVGLIGTLVGAYVWQEKRISIMASKIQELEKDVQLSVDKNDTMDRILSTLREGMAEFRAEFRAHINSIIDTQRRHEEMLQHFTDSVREFFETYDLKKKE